MDSSIVHQEIEAIYKIASKCDKENLEASGITPHTLSQSYSAALTKYHEPLPTKVIYDMAICVVFKENADSPLKTIIEGMLSSFDDRGFIMVVNASNRYPQENIYAAIVLGCSACSGALIHCSELISSIIEKQGVALDSYRISNYCFFPNINDKESIFISKENIDTKLENSYFSDVKSNPMTAVASLCLNLTRVSFLHSSACHEELIGELMGVKRPITKFFC